MTRSTTAGSRIRAAVAWGWVAVVFGLILLGCGPPPAPTDDGRGQVALTSLEAEIIAESNAVRAQGAACEAHGLTPAQYYPSTHALVADQSLISSARSHSAWMAATGDLIHQSIEAIVAAGGAGENIAMTGAEIRVWSDGRRTVTPYPEDGLPAKLVRQWLDSPGHCHNLMRAGWQRIGAAAALSDDGSYYAAQVFGR